METFTMSRKELPRPGLLAAAVAGRITNREGARALHVTPRQFQRLKQRFRVGGALAVRHQGRGRPSPRRVPPPRFAPGQGALPGRSAGSTYTPPPPNHRAPPPPPPPPPAAPPLPPR